MIYHPKKIHNLARDIIIEHEKDDFLIRFMVLDTGNGIEKDRV